MPTNDPYAVLGVDRKASQDEIRKAYRSLSKKFHPDLNPGKKDAEDRFKEVGAAYGLLSDPEKRARFDRGEIDAAGQERPSQRTFYRQYADGAPGGGPQGGGPGGAGHAQAEGFASQEDLEDFLGGMFGGGGGPFRGGPGAGAGGAGGARFRARGPDMSYSLRIDFIDAVKGATKRITLPDDSALDVRIPPGTADRQTLRLKGKGGGGFGGGEPGDAFVEVHVQPHAFFTRKDENIHLELPVTLKEAVLGAKVRTPTVDGPVMLAVPKGANTGDTLRLKGKGVPAKGDRPGEERRGDQYVTLKVVLPDAPDAALEDFCRDWQPAEDDPRRHMGVGQKAGGRTEGAA
ncbi:MAG: DnaJ C-terminal domain-containing protein [Acetobacterales bacterium]